MRLTDRVAVVTGAGSGIGRASALAFGREGAKVIVADILKGTAQETVNLIREAKGEAGAVETDVSNPDSVQNLVAQTIRTFS